MPRIGAASLRRHDTSARYDFVLLSCLGVEREMGGTVGVLFRIDSFVLKGLNQKVEPGGY